MEIIIPVNEIVEISSVELNTIETTGEIVLVDTDTIEYIEVGMQGPRGPAGANGTSGAFDPNVPIPVVPLENGTISSNTYVSTFIGIQPIDSFYASLYGAAKYVIFMTHGLERQVCELFLLHDGSNVASVEYANIVTSSILGTFSVDINGAFVRLLIDSPASGINYKVIRTLINN